MIKCIGAVIYDRNKDMVLLQQRSKHTSHPLKWGLWGGKLEKGEDFINGLMRELQEELSTVPEIIELKPIDTFVSEDGLFVYYSFLIVTENFNNIVVDSRETNDFVWLPFDKILKIDLHPATSRMLHKKYDLIEKYIKNSVDH